MIPARAVLEKALAEIEMGKAHGLDLSWLASLIDHTLLKLDSKPEDFAKLCAEAKQYHFATVCVRAEHIAFCAEALKGTNVKPIAVVGFPDGNVPTEQKAKETKQAVAAGAAEIDMVINPTLLRARSLFAVEADIRAVVQAAGSAPVKVILETCLLSDEEKAIGSALSSAAGAAFVKTSTGFSSGGATTHDIALMRSVVGPNLGVKASGGVRTLPDALRMVIAGANRIGTSNGVTIVAGSEAAASSGY